MSDDLVIALMILGAAGLAVRSAVLAWNTRQFLARASRAPGKVTR